MSGPYRRAISAGEAICDGSVRSFAAGSALVPPSAARSDAEAAGRVRNSRLSDKDYMKNGFDFGHCGRPMPSDMVHDNQINRFK